MALICPVFPGRQEQEESVLVNLPDGKIQMLMAPVCKPHGNSVPEIAAPEDP
jgi:hypothetical protein